MAKIILPSKEAIGHAMEVAGTSTEGAQYLGTRFEEILIAAKVKDESQDMLHVVREFVSLTEKRLHSSAEAWSGQQVETSGYKNMQANIAADALKQLEGFNSDMVQHVTLDFAINDNAEFLRGYSADGKVLDPAAVDAYDKSFNAWLAENNIVSKSSALYEVDNKGQIKQDAQRNQVKVNVAQVKALMNDPEKGFAQYLDKKGVQITCQQQEYPVNVAQEVARSGI